MKRAVFTCIAAAVAIALAVSLLVVGYTVSNQMLQQQQQAIQNVAATPVYFSHFHNSPSVFSGSLLIFSILTAHIPGTHIIYQFPSSSLSYPKLHRSKTISAVPQSRARPNTFGLPPPTSNTLFSSRFPVRLLTRLLEDSHTQGEVKSLPQFLSA